MKALIFRETGEPSGVLKLAEIPTPPLAPGEALVRVLLSPINPSNLHMVQGRSRGAGASRGATNIMTGLESACRCAGCGKPSGALSAPNATVFG
jgi:NADPH:quinone reductase-like Zn-dependent oxidoreductase